MKRHCLFVLPLLALAGCGEEKRAAAPKAYPVRSDYVVFNVPKAQASKQFDNGFPPLVAEDLPESAKDADQKAFHSEVESKNVMKATALPPAERLAFGDTLTKLFGTPGEPKVTAVSDETRKAHAELKLDDATLAKGGEIFRANCMQCHGLTGDGNGPGGRYLFPMPRDYRQGLFKFVTTEPNPNGTKPSRQDLYNTIYRGLPGSGMITFSGLSKDQIDAVISYVIHLSIRGEAEYQIMKLALKQGLEADDIKDELPKETEKLLKAWGASQPRRIVPDPDPYITEDQKLAAAANGYKLFQDGKEGACTTCHVNFGRNALYQYDSWGTIVRPRNLTVGIFRATNEPEAIYARVYGGIHGSGMPSHAHLRPKPEESGRTHKIWDLVHFVRTVSTLEGRQKMTDRFGIQWD